MGNEQVMRPPVPQAPIAWNDAKEWITEGSVQSLANLQRSERDNEVYDKFLDKLKKEYASTTDYLMITVFEAPVQQSPDGRQAAGPRLWPDEQQEPVCVWRLNDFPYYFEEGIEHWLLWANRALTDNDLSSRIKQKFPTQETLSWVNPVPLQSVQTIWHAHVLVRQPVMDRTH